MQSVESNDEPLEKYEDDDYRWAVIGALFTRA